MKVIAYIIIGLIILVVGACSITPIVISSISKEEREAMGIKFKEDK